MEGPADAEALRSKRLSTLKAFYVAEDRYIRENGGDFSPVAATLDPEVTLYQPLSLSYGGVWKGYGGFETWMKLFAQQWSSLQVRNSETFVDGDHIFSRSQVDAVERATGQTASWPLLQSFLFREEKILELQPFYWDTAALLQQLNSL